MCCQTVLSLLMAEVRWVWYCVTVSVGGRIVVKMACWNSWILSDSFSCPQVHCMSCRLVICAPRALQVDHASGRVWMRFVMFWSSVLRASMRWVIVVGGFLGGAVCDVGILL